MSSDIKIVYDSTRRPSDSRTRGFTNSSSSTHKRQSSSDVKRNDLRQHTVVHPTLKILTLSTLISSCLFLNPLAFICALPALYYTFKTVRYNCTVDTPE